MTEQIKITVKADERIQIPIDIDFFKLFFLVLQMDLEKMYQKDMCLYSLRKHMK